VPARLPLRSDGTRLMVLSASSLRLYWKCPERWRRRYLEREREPQTGPMLVGSAVGGAATAHFAARMAGEPLSARDTDDLVLAEFDERVERPRTRLGDDDPGELREQSREALRAYLAETAPTVRPLAVERRIELRFEGADWSFVGYVDVEDERGHVIDLKVGAKHVSQAAADRDPQAAGYLLARALEGRSAERFEFHSIRRGAIRSGERCLVVPTERSDARLALFEARIAQAARAIAGCQETGDWPLARPDGWWCAPGQCSFWASCPAGGA
jgi:PD-(D/E)XK nuclease superfamily